MGESEKYMGPGPRRLQSPRSFTYLSQLSLAKLTEYKRDCEKQGFC